VTSDLDRKRLTPWIELICAAGDVHARDRLLVECAITLECAQAAALWKRIGNEWREVLARGPADLLPKRSAFEALRTARLPANAVSSTRVFASEAVALALGGVSCDDERLDPIEALLQVFALVDTWSEADAMPGALPSRTHPLPAVDDEADKRLRHDFANILTSLRATEDMLSMLGEGLSLEETNYFKGIVDHEVSRAGELLATAFVTRPNHASESSDPVRVLEQVLAAERASNLAAGIQITTFIEPAARAVRIPLLKSALARVIQNLVVNAREALTTVGAGELWITIALAPGAHEVYLIVEDSGPGLLSEPLDRVFEPGYSTKDTASGGRGLSIVKEIVESAGGRIRVRNRKLGGAAFEMTFPQSNGRGF